MNREYPANGVLIKGQSEHQVDLLGNAGRPYRGLRFFISTMASMTSLLGPRAPGFLPPWDKYSSRYLRSAHRRKPDRKILLIPTIIVFHDVERRMVHG
jgi:hypothetical protein